MTKANTRVVDLNENLDPTGSENLYLATETTDEKISLNGVQKFLEKNFLKKSENLADINAEEGRKNLGVYSQDEVDEKNEEKADKQHKHKVEEITDFDEKVTKKIQSGIIAGENVFLEKIGEKIQINTVVGGWNGSGGAGDMQRIKNLSDLTDKAIARTNLDVYEKNEVDRRLNAKLDASQKGKALGVPELDANGFIQGKNIPDWALNMLVFWSKDEFPKEGKTGKLYFEQSTRKIYVYNGSAWYKEYTDHIGITVDTSGKANLTGGNTFSGEQILNNALHLGDYASAANQSTKARVGRASDRGEGSVVFQFGKGDASQQKFQVVDGAWTKVLFEVGINGKVMIPDWLLVGGQVFANRKTEWEAPTISLAIGDGKTGFHHFNTGKFGMYSNGNLLQDFYVGHEPVCANGLGQYPTIIKMTKAQYDALAIKENNVIYFITE